MPGANHWRNAASAGASVSRSGRRPAYLAQQIGERGERDRVAADVRWTARGTGRRRHATALSLTIVVLPIPASPLTSTTDGSPSRASAIGALERGQLRHAGRRSRCPGRRSWTIARSIDVPPPAPRASLTSVR